MDILPTREIKVSANGTAVTADGKQIKVAEFYQDKTTSTRARRVEFKNLAHERAVIANLVNLSRAYAQHCLTERKTDGTVEVTMPLAMSPYQKGVAENKRHLEERWWKVQARLLAKLEKKAGKA